MRGDGRRDAAAADSGLSLRRLVFPAHMRRDSRCDAAAAHSSLPGLTQGGGEGCGLKRSSLRDFHQFLLKSKELDKLARNTGPGQSDHKEEALQISSFCDRLRPARQLWPSFFWSRVPLLFLGRQ
jgi:hypothetical protein